MSDDKTLWAIDTWCVCVCVTHSDYIRNVCVHISSIVRL